MSLLGCPQLFKHQSDAIEFVLGRNGSGAIFHEMGLGKTRTALEIYRQIRNPMNATGHPFLNMIVIAPLSLLEAAWRNETRIAAYPYQVLNLHEEKIPESIDALKQTDADIFVINYESLMARADKIEKMIKAYPHGWMCVLDESSKIKNSKAQITKKILKMIGLFKYRIVMSGTPAPNSEMEYWPQIQFVSPGLLGNSMTAFRNGYFHLVNRYTGAVQQVSITSRAQAADMFRKCEYRITDEKRRELMARIAPVCHMAKKRDCLDLPEQIDEIRLIEMDSNQRAAYKQMEKSLVVELQGQTIAAPVALTKIMKLRQITSGFLYTDIGEALEINPLESSHPEIAIEASNEHPIWKNKKIEELLEIIEEAGNQSVIIWIQFHWELFKIQSELAKRFGQEKIAALTALTKDRNEEIRRFIDGEARFLIAHPASAAHGLTFVNCSLMVFFSLDFSLERYEQARARTHRAGQKNACVYIHLLAKRTIDERIHEVLKKKGDAQEIVYGFLREIRS